MGHDAQVRALTLLVGVCGCGRVSFDPRPDASAVDGADAFAGCATSAGLVGYWPFDENAGTVVTDYSASQQAGDLSGNVTWAPGRLGAALQFGVDAAVSLRSTAGLAFGAGTGSFTLSYWLAPASLTVQTDIRPLEFAYCTGMSYVVGHVTSGGSAMFAVYDASGHYADSSSLAGTLQIGRWTHVAHTMDRTTRTGQTYIDGVASGGPDDLSSLTDLVDCSGASFIANFGGWNNFDYTGGIDDVRLYARALSPAEITALYQLSTSGCP